MKKPSPNRARHPREALRTAFFRVDDLTFAGYVVDESDLGRRFVVELLLDGTPFRIARADASADELVIEGVGDGCYGFAFRLSQSVVDLASIIEIRIANSDIAVGAPIPLSARRADGSRLQAANNLTWIGGLRFEGWCAGDADGTPIVTAVIDGERVAEASATHWANVGTATDARLARRFDLHLPERFADGRVRRVQFVRENGDVLPGSPLTFVAFRDGLRRTIEEHGALDDERLRAAQFDRLFPMSMPFTEYANWCKRFPIADDRGADDSPIAIALVGPGNQEPTLVSLQDSNLQDWVAAALPAADAPSAFVREQMQEFLSGDAGQTRYVIFARSGTRFAPDALHRFARAFDDFPEAVAFYGDFDIEGGDGVPSPICLPAFDYERMLEQGYCAQLFALRRETAQASVAAGASDLYRLFNAGLDGDPSHNHKVVHIPGALAVVDTFDHAADSRILAQATAAHLRTRKLACRISETPSTLFPAAHVLRPTPSGSTTIVIPVRNQLGLLRSCLRSIQPAVAHGDVDIVIIDNDSSDPETIRFFNDLDRSIATVITAPGPFNPARLNNIAVAGAKGDFICLLANDVRANDDRWLPEMLSRLGDDDVGAVGALLAWPSGVVQHGGTVLGANFAAVPAFGERLEDDPGYTDLLRVAHECSAVTAACLVMRRRDYLDVGGMDELHFPFNYYDVDLCLKLRAQGKRIVLSPHAHLYASEPPRRGPDSLPGQATRYARELQSLRARWGEFLLSDPCYSPVLSLDAIPFSALAWPPRPRDARICATPVAADIPPGF